MSVTENTVEQKDFLDLLRMLNSNNINENPELRDKFFNSLMKIDESVEPIKEYAKNLSDAYPQAMMAEYDKYINDTTLSYDGRVLANYLVTEKYNKVIKSHIGYTGFNRDFYSPVIEDNVENLSILSYDSETIIGYGGSIKGMLEIVKTEKGKCHFDFFKTTVLLGLIQRYSFIIGHDLKDKRVRLNRTEMLDRLNKLLVIYAEHTNKLKPFEKMPYVVDGFIDKIIEFLESKNQYLEASDTNHILISFCREHPILKDKEYEEEYRRHKEEKLYKILMEQGYESNPEHFEDEKKLDDNEPGELKIVEVEKPKNTLKLRKKIVEIAAIILLFAAAHGLLPEEKTIIDTTEPIIEVEQQQTPNYTGSVQLNKDDIYQVYLNDGEIVLQKPEINDKETHKPPIGVITPITDKEEKETPKLWSNVRITNKEIYDNAYSAMDKQNPLRPYFGENQEYTVIGIVFSNGANIRIMDISTINSEEEMNKLIEEGYQISAYAITALGEYLDPNATRFNSEIVTGFVNPDGVEITQELTHYQGRK